MFFLFGYLQPSLSKAGTALSAHFRGLIPSYSANLCKFSSKERNKAFRGKHSEVDFAKTETEIRNPKSGYESSAVFATFKFPCSQIAADLISCMFLSRNNAFGKAVSAFLRKLDTQSRVILFTVVSVSVQCEETSE